MFAQGTEQEDHIVTSFRSYAQNILVIIFGLLPLIFVPVVTAPYDYTKFSVVVAGVFVALVLYSLSVLRSGVITVGVSYPLSALWVVTGVTFLSALLSGDFKDSLVGDFFSIHSVVFVAALALIPTVWTLLKPTKAAVMRLYILLAVSTLILVVFHILRIFLGPDFLSLGVFAGNTMTPVGSWNDLALFLGLTVILSLIALEQLSLTRVGQGLFAAVILASLAMLGVINFFSVWIVLGITALVMIVYGIRRDRFEGSQLPLVESKQTNKVSLGVSLVVFAVSVLFVIGGATLGGAISAKTGVSYVEVRPSLEATADIARNVYRENAFLGIGANKFTDAWRMYKDDAINLTPFWSTDFNAGNGYVTTFFVTTGVLGGIAWVVFLVTFLVTGIRRLLTAPAGDKMWYFIGVSSFVSAAYIWGMAIVYVPGVVILLLGSLCTGVSLAALNVIGNTPAKTITVGANRRAGFALTLAVITIIIGSVSILYVAGRHYSSVYTFNESLLAMQEGKAIEELERQVESAYQLSSSDVFARRIAEYQLARMNRLIGLESPTEDDQRQFQNASILGINAAQQATQIDRTEPANWSVLGGIYGALASVGVSGAKEKAAEAFTEYKDLNPKSPLPYLELAILEGRSNNLDAARAYTEEAIARKRDFTEAFFFLSQLEIATGNVDAAIQSTQATVALEPQNPVRYYQLGVLLGLGKDVAGAAAAFERAVALDQNYSNARYLLALAYDELGRSPEAKDQLRAVLALNPGNAEVENLIKVLDEEGSLKRLRDESSRLIPEQTPVTSESGTVSATDVGDSPLVTPVNTAPKVDAPEIPTGE